MNNQDQMKHYLLPIIVLILFFSSCQKDAADISGNNDNSKNIEPNINAAVEGVLIDGATYRIRGLASINNGPVLEVAGNSINEGALIQQWSWFPLDGQKWKLELVDGTYYRLINIKSNKCLQSFSSTSGDILKQGTYSNSDLQKWAIAYNTTNKGYTITNKGNGMKVVVDPNNNTPGTKIRQSSTTSGTQNFFEFHNLEFQNPLVTADSADPFVAYKDGFYYFLSTKGNRIVITKTKNMSLLALGTSTRVYTPPTGTMYSDNLWAPELFFLEGKWYIYFAADNGTDTNHRMYVLENSSTDPTTGSWIFKGKITDPSDQWAIDGTILTIDNQNYFVWSGWESTASRNKQHIYIAKMSNPWTITGERSKIVTPIETWERWEGSGSLGVGVNEAPIILQRDENSPLYIIYSASRYNSDNYCLASVKLTKGADPMLASSWTDKKQVFEKNPSTSVYGPGHNGFFESSYVDALGKTRKESWFIYHARSAAGEGGTGVRTSRIQKLTWSSEGIPDFGTPIAITEKIPIPIGE